MVNIEREIIRHSVEDVIRILENEPVKGDMVPEITAVQVMNRVSIAHLSIERALKFLITKAEGSFEETHDLRHRHQELRDYDPAAAESLDGAFEAAVGHYQYKPNADSMKHLKSLERYLEVTGSNKAFQDIRYWELTQSLDEIRLRQVYLSIHIELLHGLSEILLAPDRPKETVADRVEREVSNAMWPAAKMAYSPGTSEERSINSYIAWLQGFSSKRKALTEAVQKGFNIGDNFMANVAGDAYATLRDSADPAVSYFASTLDVLPKQSRDVIPCVEWLDPEKKLNGLVKTPAGTDLGIIKRGLDGLWCITPLREGLVRVSAKARSQTDARCYLGILLTRPARVTVEGKDRSLRIVEEGYNPFQRNYDEINRRYEGTCDDKTWTHKMTLWDKDHGIDINKTVRVEVPRRDIDRVLILEGTVTEVAEHEVYLSASEMVDKEQKGHD